MKRKPPLYVQDTIVGKGVFACRSFPAEAVVAEVLGQVIDDPDYGSDYCIDLGGSVSLEPAEPFRFLNHSCSPNCEFVMWDDSDEASMGTRVWLSAIRPIAVAEQLTIDYAWSADVAIPCRCQSQNCRGWIVNAAELDKLSPASLSSAVPLETQRPLSV